MEMEKSLSRDASYFHQQSHLISFARTLAYYYLHTMNNELKSPPLLSTPDTHVFSEVGPTPTSDQPTRTRPSDEELSVRYEITRTISEIRAHRWKRIALQFPDEMLRDSANVYQLLARRLQPGLHKKVASPQGIAKQKLEQALDAPATAYDHDDEAKPIKLTILADTSYGSCCVDEIAAEHVEADAAVHYGRACLSPTARIPVLHVYTKNDLDHSRVLDCFKETFPDLSSKVIVTADVTFADHVEDVYDELTREGYSNIFAASIIHDPSSAVPNRTVPLDVRANPDSLHDWQLFHISQPPTSLLLTLSSRVAAVYIYPTDQSGTTGSAQSAVTSTSSILRRRYALVTSLASVPIWGILINTLSVKNYLHMVDHVRQQITAAGKKSYLFVVGKLNAAKVANFGEIGGWVVIGCWESSLIDSKDFYKPVVTPYELDLALKRDEDRLWTGEWRGDFQSVLDDAAQTPAFDESALQGQAAIKESVGTSQVIDSGDVDSEEESAPPEFDLRTGRYVSDSRPMERHQARAMESKTDTPSVALARRPKGDIVAVNGVHSPAAEFLRSKRTWQGLGSDFEIAYEEDGEEDSTAIQEGRSGIARGYTVADSARA